MKETDARHPPLGGLERKRLRHVSNLLIQSDALTVCLPVPSAEIEADSGVQNYIDQVPAAVACVQVVFLIEPLGAFPWTPVTGCGIFVAVGIVGNSVIENIGSGSPRPIRIRIVSQQLLKNRESSL